MTISIPKIDKQFCIAFAERNGFDVPDPKNLHIDGDWLFHFDEKYPDEMDIYQYPLADFCCEVYDSCTVEQFNDPKLRQAFIQQNLLYLLMKDGNKLTIRKWNLKDDI